jgi:hypothetical protein
MLGGSSGSILDKMIAGNVGTNHQKILDVVGKMVIASGNGASDDRLLGMVEQFGVPASDILALVQNPANLPVVMWRQFEQTGGPSRLVKFLQGVGNNALDTIAGRKPPVLRPIGALPSTTATTTAPPGLRIVQADGKVVPNHSQDAVMDRELQGRPLLNPTADAETRPENSMKVAASNLVSSGVDAVRQMAGDQVAQLAEQVAVNISRAAAENLPVPDGVKDAIGQVVQSGVKNLGGAVADAQRYVKGGDNSLQIEDRRTRRI